MSPNHIISYRLIIYSCRDKYQDNKHLYIFIKVAPSFQVQKVSKTFNKHVYIHQWKGVRLRIETIFLCAIAQSKRLMKSNLLPKITVNRVEVLHKNHPPLKKHNKEMKEFISHFQIVARFHAILELKCRSLPYHLT